MLRKIRSITSVWLLVILATFGACNGPRYIIDQPAVSGEDHRLVKDGLGREVRVPKKVTRVISLAPNLTEMVFAVGAGSKLVGVTTYCNYPDEAKIIEKVGDTLTANIERIITLKPDVVLISTASQLETFTEVLDRQGISVYVTDPDSMQNVFESLRNIGDLLGSSETALSVAKGLERRVDEIGPPPTVRPKVFVQISKEPLFTIGGTSFLTEVVEKAGGTSATKEMSSAYPKISKENALSSDPDIIILSDSDDNREPNKIFSSSTAVRSQRILRMNADILARPGPRTVDALEQIADFIRTK